MSWNNSALEPNITAAVRAMAARYPGVPLYAVGHSMGAAMATIAALDLKFKANLSDVRLVTFGSPRVGNEVFARFLQSQTTVRAPVVTSVVHNVHEVIGHAAGWLSRLPEAMYVHVCSSAAWTASVQSQKVAPGVGTHRD